MGMGHSRANRRTRRSACPHGGAEPRFALTEGGMRTLWDLVDDQRLADHERRSLSQALVELEDARATG
jgi:hypothetical protein